MSSVIIPTLVILFVSFLGFMYITGFNFMLSSLIAVLLAFGLCVTIILKRK